MWNETIEEKYERLLRKYNNLQNDYERLQKKYNKVDDELSSANHRIQYELEPRLKTEKASYDSYVLSGGSGCFATGMNGGCNLDCSGFGEEDGCREMLSGITNEELFKYYQEHEAFDGKPIIREELLNRGLEKEVGYADNVYCEQVITKYEKDIENINYWKTFYEDVLENGYKG